MILVKDAESLILDLVKPLEEYEEVNLDKVLGRILAQDILSDLDFPPWHNSAMDGYAFCHGHLDQFETLTIASSHIPAGSSQDLAINKGECVRIFTGGILPLGADTVVMQEDVEIVRDIVGIQSGGRHLEENRLKLKTSPKLGDYVRQKGEYYRAGEILLKSGIRINPPEIGILAATQHQMLRVFRQPRVSIISTGNELKEISSSLQKGQIVDSNQYALSGSIAQIGAVPISMGIVRDRPEDLSEIILKALSLSDFVISSGGVSVGDYDYVENVLADLGGDIHIRSCAIKPGKPFTVASFGHKLYFGVPGNPASAMVCFWRFIKGAIAKLSGVTGGVISPDGHLNSQTNSQYWYPQYIQAIALQDLHAQGQRETYLSGYLAWEHNYQRWQFQPVSNHSSGNLISWAGVNGLAILKVNQTYIPKGDTALIMML